MHGSHLTLSAVLSSSVYFSYVPSGHGVGLEEGAGAGESSVS